MAFPSINISFLGDISTIFGGIISFPERTSGWKEGAPMLCDETARKVSFIGGFVDGWGKIHHRQMGEDNRQMGQGRKIDHKDLEQKWSKNEISFS